MACGISQALREEARKWHVVMAGGANTGIMQACMSRGAKGAIQGAPHLLNAFI